jgi:hypothetical protein
MSYGNWCGQGWTAGQKKAAKFMTKKDFDVPAVDEYDEACKQHDIDIFNAQDNTELLKQADEKFTKKMSELGGVTGYVMGTAVQNFGPSAHMNTKKRLRGSKMEDDEVMHDFWNSKKKKQFKHHKTSLRRSIEESAGTSKDVEPAKNLNQTSTETSGNGGAWGYSSGGDNSTGWVYSDVNMTDTSQDTSFQNNTNTTNMDQDMNVEDTVQLGSAPGGVAQGRRKGDETSVDPTREVKLWPFHKTQDVVMPWMSTFTVPIDTTNKLFTKSFRLNCITDIQAVSAPTTLGDVAYAPDAINGTVQIPQGLKYWSKMYNYWTVKKTTYKLTIFPITVSNVGPLTSLWIYHHGLQPPPLYSAATVPLTDWERKWHHNCHHRVLSVPRNVSQSDTWGMRHEINGYYDPTTIDHEVVEDEHTETWHKWTDVPSSKEYLTIIMNNADVSPAPVGLDAGVSLNRYRVQLEIKYHVQLKDLKSEYQFPTIASGMPLIEKFIEQERTID